jgi:hypothetical protein
VEPPLLSRAPWWQRAVVYQIYPRSFADASGDGVGDLRGIRDRLEYLEWLGVDAIWLSPVFRSPMADFGYDVSDYCDVDPLFGTLADLDALVADAHAHGIRLLLDWVPNHTSDRHPWFVESRRSRADPRRDWYVWRDPAPGGGAPNNWTAAFRTGAPAWTLDPATGQHYLHLFLPQQPDLNWANPAVESAMHGVLRFWLDRGIDGFRVDVVHALGKNPALPDDPADLAALPHSSLHDDPATHPILRRLRRLVDAYPGDRVLVGEVFQLFQRDVTRFYGKHDELHLAFRPATHAAHSVGGGRLASASRGGRGEARRRRRVADHRALEPRHASAALAPRLRGPGALGGGPRADATRDAVPVCRRGARPRGRGRPSGAAGRSRRARRLPRPDPVGGPRPDTDGRPRRGCRGHRIRPGGASRRSGVIPTRSCISTGGSSPPAVVHPPCSSGACGACPRRPASSPGNASPRPTAGASP